MPKTMVYFGLGSFIGIVTVNFWHKQPHPEYFSPAATDCISLTATQDTQLISWLSISTVFINFTLMNLHIVLLRTEKLR